MIRRCASAGFTPLKRFAQAGFTPPKRWFTYTLFWLAQNADDNLYGFEDEDFEESSGLDSEPEEEEWGDPIPYVLAELTEAV